MLPCFTNKKIFEPQAVVQKVIPKNEDLVPNIGAELKTLYPQIKEHSLSKSVVNRIDTTKNDTVTLFVGKFSNRLPVKEQKRLSAWLEQCIKADSGHG